MKTKASKVLKLAKEIAKRWGIEWEEDSISYKVEEQDKRYPDSWWLICNDTNRSLRLYYKEDRIVFLALLEHWARIELKKSGFHWTRLCDVEHTDYLTALLLAIKKIKEDEKDLADLKDENEQLKNQAGSLRLEITQLKQVIYSLRKKPHLLKQDAGSVRKKRIGTEVTGPEVDR